MVSPLRTSTTAGAPSLGRLPDSPTTDPFHLFDYPLLSFHLLAGKWLCEPPIYRLCLIHLANQMDVTLAQKRLFHEPWHEIQARYHVAASRP
jgi:hypothetical protein